MPNSADQRVQLPITSLLGQRVVTPKEPIDPVFKGIAKSVAVRIEFFGSGTTAKIKTK